MHASLGFLLEHLPPGLRLVLASRADPPLPLARLRARGQLAELRAADLRFTADEAAALLRESVRADLPDARRGRAGGPHRGLGGGPAAGGAVAARASADVAGFVAAFTGSHRYVLDYLAEEVLDRQPDAAARRSCWRPRCWSGCSGPLCDAVTGRADGQAAAGAGGAGRPVPGAAGRGARLVALPPPVRRPAPRPPAAEQPGAGARAAPRARRPGTTSTGWPTTPSGTPWRRGDDWAARLVERALRRALLPARRGATIAALAGGAARRAGPVPAPAAAGAGAFALDRRPAGGGRAAAGRGRAGGRRGRTSRIEPSAGRAAQPAGQRPGADRARPRAYLAELRGDAEAAAAFAPRALAQIGEGELAAALPSPGVPGVAEWLARPAGRGRAAPSAASVAGAAGGRPALPGRLRAAYDLGQVQRAQGRLDAALAHLPAGAGDRGAARPAAAARRRRRLRAAWPRLPTSGTSSTPPSARHRRASRCAGSSSTRRRWPPAWPRWPGSGRPRATRPAPWRRSDEAGRCRAELARGRPAQSRAGAAGPAAAGPGRRGRGRRAGRSSGPRPATTSPATRGAGATWCWPGCCSPRTAPVRPSRCWSGCTPAHCPGPGRQPHRDPGAAGAGAGGQGRAGGRGVHPGRGAHARLAAGVRPGVRRRGRADGRAAGPAHRGPAGRAGHARGVPLDYLARLLRAFEPDAPAALGLVEPLSRRELEVLRCWRRESPTSRSPTSWWWRSTPSKDTSATSWGSSARPTAPRQPSGPAGSGCSRSDLPPRSAPRWDVAVRTAA